MSLETCTTSISLKKIKISETHLQPALSMYVTLDNYFIISRSKVHPKVCNSEDEICKKF